MKKHYEAPAAATVKISGTSFLELSGEILAVDTFADDYGEQFS